MMKMDVSWRKASRRSFYFLLLIYFERIFHTWIWYCRFSSQIFLSDKIMVLSFIDIPMYAIECFWHISVDIIPCFCLLVLITRLSLVNKVSRWNYISRSDYPKIISSLLNPYSSKNYVKIHLEGVPSLCLGPIVPQIGPQLLARWTLIRLGSAAYVPLELGRVFNARKQIFN